MCGGTAAALTAGTAAIGLSPRVRGNPRPSAARRTCWRSIPACAGEPPLSMPGRARRGVYPRVCGGTDDCVGYCHNASGLSPRVRGNRHHSGGRRNDARSIPACAGEPVVVLVAIVCSPVYPRVCGGTPVADVGEYYVNGLSPRVRGTSCAAFWPAIAAGLSPRVRGNLHQVGRALAAVRSIPACAGEPRRFPPAASWGRVYPRVCGGTTIGLRVNSRPGGLSPRVRGNPVSAVYRTALSRSIPACAGEPTTD